MRGFYIFVVIITSLTGSAHSFPVQNSTSCAEGEAFSNVTGKCHVLNFQGPCGEYMSFVKSPNKTQEGQCACDKISQGCATRPMLFWPLENRCYPIYNKGPCHSGEWLIVDYSDTPICKNNPCQLNNLTNAMQSSSTVSQDDVYPSTEFTFLKNNECYTTKSQAYCPAGQVVYFPENSLQPNCYPSKQLHECNTAVSFSIANVVPNLKCPEGTQEDAAGNCNDTVVIS